MLIEMLAKIEHVRRSPPSRLLESEPTSTVEVWSRGPADSCISVSGRGPYTQRAHTASSASRRGVAYRPVPALTTSQSTSDWHKFTGAGSRCRKNWRSDSDQLIDVNLPSD